jgi:hypothetical protein
MKRYLAVIICLCVLVACKENEDASGTQRAGKLNPLQVAEAIGRDPNLNTEPVLKDIQSTAKMAGADGKAIVTIGSRARSGLDLYCGGHADTPSCSDAVRNSIDPK